MNKIITLKIFLLVVIFCFPVITHGATMELTVTISSFKIPIRAGMDLAVDRPNTEYIANGGRITVINKNNVFIAKGDLIEAGTTTSNKITRNASATVGFPYEPSLLPYNVYTEIRVQKDGVTSNIRCKADCTGINGTTGYYYISNLRYWKPDFLSSSDSYCYAPFCAGAYSRYGITIPGDNVIEDYWWSGNFYNYYWRSPSILEIN